MIFEFLCFRLEAEGAKTSEKVVEPFLQKPDQVVQQVDQVDVIFI